MKWYIQNTLWVLAFAAQHSLGTTAKAKSWMARLAGGRPYLWNALYNVSTLALLALMVVFWKPSGVVLWDVGKPWMYGFIAAQVLAVMTFLYLFKFTQPFGEWIGYSQVIRMVRGDAEPKGEGYRIKKHGIKRYIRFPHHTVLLFMFWALPRMTADLALLAAQATLYLWLGSLHQDFRGRSYFPGQWHEYSRNSRMMIPAVEHIVEDVQAWYRKRMKSREVEQ